MLSVAVIVVAAVVEPVPVALAAELVARQTVVVAVVHLLLPASSVAVIAAAVEREADWFVADCLLLEEEKITIWTVA